MKPIYVTFAAFCVSACTQTPAPVNVTIDLGQIETDRSGKCFAKDTSPAVIETVTTTVIVKPAVRDDNGDIVTPAVTEDHSAPRMITDRQNLRFETVCPPDYTSQFVAVVQRALIVRGYYRGTVNGNLDAATSKAIMQFQADQGLNTPFLALETARKLGAVALDRDSLQ